MPQAKLIIFDNISLRPTIRKGVKYLSSPQIADCLGYKEHAAISRIFARNQDEFSSDMYLEEENINGNLKYKTRLFNKRGIQMLCLLANTKKAKAFRKWVLDVLEEKTAQPQQQQLSLPAPQTTTPKNVSVHAQAEAFKALPELINMRSIALVYRSRNDLSEIEAKNADTLFQYLTHEMNKQMRIVVPSLSEDAPSAAAEMVSLFYKQKAA